MNGIASTISRKYCRALKEEANSRLYFEELTSTAPQENLETWTLEIEEAETNRHENVESMDIMQSRVSKGVQYTKVHAYELCSICLLT